MSTKNRDLARVEREVEILQDQLYALQKANEGLSEAVEELRRAMGRVHSPSSAAPPELSPSETSGYQEAPGSVMVRSLEPVPERTTVMHDDRSGAIFEAPTENEVEEETIPGNPEPSAPPASKPSDSKLSLKEPPDPIYTMGLKSLNVEDFNGAVMNFERFIDKEPDSRLADNAQFFIAEAYLRAENYPQAIVEYNRVVDLYPEGDAVPEALFKIGLSYSELNDRRNALAYYRRVIKQYPNSSAAFSARRSLKQME